MARLTKRSVPDDTLPIDDKVDDVFGEPVVLKPMRTGSSGYRESVPDTDRPIVNATGIYDQTRGANQETGGGLIHRQATVDTSLSIRVEPLLQCDLRKGDRVTFPARGETYEVSHIYEDPGGRPDVHLLRVLDV